MVCCEHSGVSPTANMSEQVALSGLVRGRVQGVGFRAFVLKQARQLGLSGWVRNRHDGPVEFFVVGNTDCVAAIVEACKDGPRFARVDEVLTTGADVAQPRQGFEILPDK